MTVDPNPYEASLTADTPPVDPKSARNELLPVAIAFLVLPVLHIMGGLMFFAFVFNIVNSPDADPETKQIMTCGRWRRVFWQSFRFSGRAMYWQYRSEFGEWAS